jgi:hypothetical protein
MSKIACVQCEKEFWPRQYNQRFCLRGCGDAWLARERRDALATLRAQTYLGRSEAEPQGGGRFAGQVPTLTPDRFPAPAWSRDQLPQEPAHDATADGLEYGVAIDEAGR